MKQKRKNRKRQSRSRKDEDVPTEVLSMDEIDQLLTAINAGNSESENFKPAADSRKIKIYDFKRPDKFSKEHISAVSIIHDTFARMTSASLSAQLNSKVRIHVASVDQLTYDEFIRSIPTPTTLAIINLTPLKGNAVLEIDPAVTFSIIDRICGGTGDGINYQHELTDIEQSIMEEIIVQMLMNLSKAWTRVIDLRPRLEQIDIDPKLAQIVPPAEMVLLVTMEAKVGHVEGMINFGIPYTSIESIIYKFSTAYWFGNKTLSDKKNSNLTNREDIPVEMTAEILKRDYPFYEITKWKTGTIILPLRPLAPSQCFLGFGKRRVWRCEIIPENKWFLKQIKIVELVDKPFGMEGKEMEIEMPKINPLVGDALANAGIRITAELGSTVKSVKEVFSMGEGTIVELDKLAGEPVDVKANGVLFAKGEVVVLDENFGVRITDIAASGFLIQPVPSEDE